MNDEAKAKWKREAELDALTSAQLADLLTAMGWAIGGRQNKANRRNAVLYLEKYLVSDFIMADLKLRPLEPVT